MSNLLRLRALLVAATCLAWDAAAWNAVPANAAEPLPTNLPPGKKWKLVWSDEFGGTELDRTKWDFRLHIMHTRFDTWTEDAAALDGRGNLLLKLYEKGGNYYTSQLQTGSNFMDRPGSAYSGSRFTWPIGKLEPAKFLHKYGYYEIRCQLPKQPGWWVAFWLQSPTIGASLDSRTAGVEIDIMENFTRDGVISHNLHWNGYGTDHKHLGSGPVMRPELCEGFHTYGLDWSPSGYVFYVDGQMTWRADGPVSDREQFVMVTAECNGYRKGGPAPELKRARLPDQFTVDYIRVFDEVPARPE